MQYSIYSNVEENFNNSWVEYDDFIFKRNKDISLENEVKVVTYEEAYKMCMKFK
jgi:hypothetical protein